MSQFIQEQDFEIGGKKFILSKLPATVGREIVTQYISSGMPKIGDYKLNEAMMLKMMRYVQVVPETGANLALSSQGLIDSHISDWETLAKIEIAMLEYNVSFFQNGRISNFLTDTAQKLPRWISKILADSLAPLLQKEKPPSTNSEQSTV